MAARIVLACFIAAWCNAGFAATRGAVWSVSVFENDLSRRSGNVEASSFIDSRVSSQKTFQGSLGLAIERRLTSFADLGVSLERRRDVFAEARGGRLCGPVHNTCFDTHRLELVSKPVSVFVRVIAPEWKERATVSGTVGVRYVVPRVRDLTPASSVPAYLFGVDASRRLSVEARLGATLRVLRKVSIFADSCRLLRSGTEWDPRRRFNAGLRMNW